MTGPEHYLEAERLIAMARESHHADLYGHESDAQSALILADAQVHATLAAAAATALSGERLEGRAWADVAGTRMAPPENPPGREPARPGR
jgi:hypothetical protein